MSLADIQLDIQPDVQAEVRCFVQPQREISREISLEKIVTTSTTITAVEAREHSRMLLADAFNSLTIINQYQNAKNDIVNRVKRVKQELKELRDSAIDADTRKTYDNFYRTAHLQIGNKVRKLSGCRNENILPLLLYAGIVSGGENKKERARINKTTLLFYYIIGSAIQNKYNNKQIGQLLEKTCDGSYFTNDMRRLEEKEVQYAREKIMPKIEEYKDRVTIFLNRLGNEITPPPGIPERRAVIDRGLKVLEQRAREDEKQVLKYANKVFLAYSMHEPPTEPGIERSDPQGNKSNFTMKEVVDAHEERRVYQPLPPKHPKSGDNTLQYVSKSSAQVQAYVPTPEKTRKIVSLAKIVTAGGALAAGFALATGIVIFSYFNREKEGVEEAVVSDPVPTLTQEEKNKELAAPVAEIKLQQQTQIMYEPHTAPVYNPKDPAPWYQIEKAELSADGSSLELKLGDNLITEGKHIRLRYETQEGKIKTNYKVPQEIQTLDVNGKILDMGVGVRGHEGKGFRYYSSVNF